MTVISTRIPLGSAATATAVRAGQVVTCQEEQIGTSRPDVGDVTVPHLAGGVRGIAEVPAVRVGEPDHRHR
jgi:hypothetical protein